MGFELLLLDVVRKCCDTDWLTTEWVSLHTGWASESLTSKLSGGGRREPQTHLDWLFSEQVTDISRGGEEHRKDKYPGRGHIRCPV